MKARTRAMLAAAVVTVGVAAGAGPASAGVTTTTNGNTLTINGTAQREVIFIRSNKDDHTLMEVVDSTIGKIVATFDYGSFDTLQVNLGDGNDILTIDGEPTIGETTSLFGGGGNDTIDAGDGNEFISGGPGDDHLDGRGGNDNIVADADADTIRWSAGDGTDNLHGGAGRDELHFVGASFADKLDLAGIGGSPDGARLSLPTTHADTSGFETLSLFLFGGDDNVAVKSPLPASIGLSVSGDAGADTITTGDTNDIVQPGSGNDVVSTGGGNDRLDFTFSGNDTFDGGPGNDAVAVQTTGGDDNVNLLPGKSADRLTVIARPDAHLDAGGAEHVSVATGSGDDSIVTEPAVAGLFHLAVDASTGNDVIVGTATSDELSGGSGNDTIDGREGDDLVIGGIGVDRLTGGPGADSFVCGDPVDQLVDFSPEDTLADDCGPAPVTPVPPAEQPAPSQPSDGAPVPPAGPPAGQGTPPAGLPAGFLGFAPKPVVKANLKSLSVTVTNTHTAPVTVKVAASERDAGAKKATRFKAVTRTIAPGQKVTIKLATPKALKALLAKALEKKGKATRKPAITVTNVATSGHVEVKPKVTLKKKRR